MKTLVRRARAKVSTADDSMDVDSSTRASVEPETSENARRSASVVVSVPQYPTSATSNAVIRAQPPTPTKPSRLKRRVGTQAQSAASQIFPPSEDVFVPEAEEPKHKRYKALFDSYDPDKIAQMLPDEYGSQQVPVSGAESVTQFEPSASVTFAPDTEGTSRSGTGSRTKTTVRSGTSGVGGFGSLGPLMEEEEESTMGSATGGVTQSQRGTKRRAEEDEDVEMGEDAHSVSGSDAEGDMESEDEDEVQPAWDEDGFYRCGKCSWEIADGWCQYCLKKYPQLVCDFLLPVLSRSWLTRSHRAGRTE